MKKIGLRLIRIFLIANLLLFLSSLFFAYKNFTLEIVIISVLLVVGLFVRKLWFASVGFGVFFYVTFLVWNINYLFVLGICIVLGILIYNFIKPEMKISPVVYSLVGVFLLLHIIWWNFLPLGFNGNYELDVGSFSDMDASKNIYINDKQGVLSPAQAYGEMSWREFVKNGNLEVGVNSEVSLKNRSIEVMMDYASNSPIYVNSELFYSPNWDSFVKVAEFEDGNLFVDRIVLNEMCYEKFVTKSGLDVMQKNLVDVSFRGAVDFRGVFKDKIEVSFVKTDRNWYEGNDTVLFQIVDSSGKVVFEEIILDNDGIVIGGSSATENSSKEFEFVVSDVEFGSYGVVFKDLSVGQDVEISNIEVNTNKFELVSSSFYVLNDVVFYFNSSSELEVQFWHKGYNQDVIFSDVNGSKINFSLVEDDIKTSKKVDLDGFYKFEVDKGNLIFKNFGTSFGFWEDGFVGNYECDFEKDLEFNYSLGSQNFIEEYFETNLDLFDSTKSLDVANLNQNNFERYYENFEQFEEVNFEMNLINTSFRGDVCFVGYFGESIRVEVLKQDINMYEGPENVVLNITSKDSGISYEFDLPDDGEVNKSTFGPIQSFDFAVDDVEKGFYDLCFRGVNNSGSDFELKNISFNSNKVMSSGYVYIRGPAKVYFDNSYNFDYRFYHNMKQDLILEGDLVEEKKVNVVYSEESKSKWHGVNVSGYDFMEIEQGNLMFQVSGETLFFGYSDDAVFKTSINPKLLFTKSKNVSSSQKLNLVIDESKLNLKSGEGTQLFNIGVKYEK